MRNKALDKRQIRRNFLVEDGIAAFEGGTFWVKKLAKPWGNGGDLTHSTGDLWIWIGSDEMNSLFQ